MQTKVTKLAKISVCGVVQGVGFRPFVYRLAQDYNLKGWVRNTSGSVEIEVEGDEESLENCEKADEIVNILQKVEVYKSENAELKKYKAMWGELKEKYNRESINKHCPEGLKDEILFVQEIKILEQKHF